MPDDPTTEAGWSEASRAASRRMRRALRKIDHERRAALIDRDVRGTITPAEKAELETLQQACDDAMAEYDDLKLRYLRWQVVQIGGERLARLLEGEPMRKRDELTVGCMAKARDDELTFVLLGRDKAAPRTIRHWIRERIEMGLNRPGDAKLVEAEECACTMEAEREVKTDG